MDPDAPPESAARKRILVVDDAAIMRRYLERVFTDAGFDADCAQDGAEGLDRVAACPPDLIVADLNMPRMGGLAMLASLRSDPKARQVPVIVLSSEDKTRDFAQARAQGANFFVIKPPERGAIVSLARLMSGRAGADD